MLPVLLSGLVLGFASPWYLGASRLAVDVPRCWGPQALAAEPEPPAASAVDDDAVADDCDVGDQAACDLVDAKAELLAALEPVDRGFAASREQRQSIDALLQKLTAQVSTAPSAESGLGGDWVLVYSDAPDILSLRGGPLAKLRRIGQQIDPDARTIDNVIEYVPADWIRTGFGGATAQDSLQQRVLLNYEPKGSKVDIKIRGTSIKPAMVLGVNLLAAPPLALEGGLALPFGSFELKYNDGDMRVVKTKQGYWGVNRRLAGDEAW